MAQKQASIWYLQDYGIDFNQSPPKLLREVAFHQNRAMGIATDKNGNLLFYTDNFTVFNRLHEKMPNGKDLLDPNQSFSSLQNSVVVQKPGSEVIFYVFMVDPWNGSVQQSGLYYFVVDLSLANGKGDVSVRPQKLVSSTSNKLAAVLHTNRTDVWVTTQIAGSNTYKTFLINAIGVSDPLTQSLGTNVSSFTAQLKFSPDGTKVASSDGDNINLIDFDASTGELSNARTLVLPQSLRPSAVSFSPDGTKLYAATQAVVQYDVSSGDVNTIKASEHVLTSYVNNNFYNFQLAIDGKIYITKGGGGGTSDYLGAITNPNESGNSANVVEEYFFLEGFDSFVNWTPNFIESYFLQPEILAENTCLHDETKLRLSNSMHVKGVKWDVGEGGMQTTLDVSHMYSAAGTWNVKAEVNYGDRILIVTKDVQINELPVFNLGPDRTVCEGVPLTINTTNIAKYKWSTGETTRILEPGTSGLYAAEAIYESTGCRFDDEVNLVISETPFVDLGPDSVVCNKPAYVLRSRTVLSNVEFTWNDPAIMGPELIVNTGGFYSLKARSVINGCVHQDSVYLALKFAPEPDLGPDRTINRDESFVLDMTKYGPGTFLWENLSTSAIRSVNGKDLNIGPNIISLKITGSNGCIGSDTANVVVNNIVGLEDKLPFVVFPNPTKDMLFIEAPVPIHISVITLTGSLVANQFFESGKASIDLGSYPDGVYVLEMKLESGIVRQFIAKH